MARIINSPGVQITEIDEAGRRADVFGTDIFVAGFAPKGPIDEIISPSTVSEFEQIYGTPTNAAERYFYYSVAPLFNTGANLLLSRLPYGSDRGQGFGSQFSALVYPVVGATTTAPMGNSYTYALSTALSAIPSLSSIAVTFSGTNTLSAQAATRLSDATSYTFGQPTHFSLTQQQYDQCMKGEAFSWANFSSTNLTSAGTVSSYNAVSTSISNLSSFGNAGMIIFNKAQTTINDKYEGYYVAVIDNTSVNPATDYNSVLNALTITSSGTTGRTTFAAQIPKQRLNFALSGTAGTAGSVSEVMENLESFNLNNPVYNDTLSLGIFKLRQSIFAPDTIVLDYILEERIVGSLDFHSLINDQNGGPSRSFFLETRASDSRNVTVMVNDFISNRNSLTWLGSAGLPTKSARVASNQLESQTTVNFSTTDLFVPTGSAAYVSQITSQRSSYAATSAAIGYPINGVQSSLANSGFVDADNIYALGTYATLLPADKQIGSVPLKLERILQLLENDEVYDIDLTVEAGLGTIHAINKILSASGTYDDLTNSTSLSAAIANMCTTGAYQVPQDTNLDLRGNYTTIFNIFDNFASNVRRDHMFISDPIRQLLVLGRNSKVLPQADKNWSQHVFSPLRHQFSLTNTSYAAMYANWVRVNDRYSNENVWMPSSGFVASEYAKTDRDRNVWWAPAGFTRGILNVDDIVLTPNQKQRDDLYKFNLNPVTFFARDGIVIFGQKTLQKAPGVFDRVNVRRLFLLLEKQTKAVAKYYVFEPNTLYTRTRLVDDLRPYFEQAKNDQGLYDYLIVCDERNNTPDIIDANELVVDIYIKPVRVAEFILVNFRATRTSTNFAELVR
jgi:hypothetical protein